VAEVCGRTHQRRASRARSNRTACLCLSLVCLLGDGPLLQLVAPSATPAASDAVVQLQRMWRRYTLFTTRHVCAVMIQSTFRGWLRRYHMIIDDLSSRHPPSHSLMVYLQGYAGAAREDFNLAALFVAAVARKHMPLARFRSCVAWGGSACLPSSPHGVKSYGWVGCSVVKPAVIARAAPEAPEYLDGPHLRALREAWMSRFMEPAPVTVQRFPSFFASARSDVRCCRSWLCCGPF
jgi:hypothetical protein